MRLNLEKVNQIFLGFWKALMSNFKLVIFRFVESMPLKQCAPEDFLTEAELLCSYWKIESPIDLEDGQPFIYEAESLFYNRFQDQVQQNILAPYEGLSGKPAGDRGAATSNDYSDLWTEKMASFAEYSVLPDKKSNIISLKYIRNKNS